MLHSLLQFTPKEMMTIDRDSLIDAYAQQILDNMDMKTMEQMVYDTLVDNLNSYSDEELITEVEEYNPELLED
jgi:hypothetical protein